MEQKWREAEAKRMQAKERDDLIAAIEALRLLKIDEETRVAALRQEGVKLALSIKREQEKHAHQLFTMLQRGGASVRVVIVV